MNPKIREFKMRMFDALTIIAGKEIINTGFMVDFERKEGNLLHGDHFPAKFSGEELIKTKKRAWRLAKLFAAKTVGKCLNIHIVDEGFNPVPDYETIKNRKDSDADT